MSRQGYGGPKLPRALLDKVQSGGISKNKRALPRKDRRKAERQAKRQSHRAQPRNNVSERSIARTNAPSGSSSPEDTRNVSAPVARKRPANDALPAKSILKKSQPQPDSEEETDIEDEDEIEVDVGDEQESEETEEDEIVEPVVSRSTKRKLDEDDAEIAALEKKLKIKGKKSKALQEDGLDWLAGGSEDESEDDERPDDVDWLKRKRRKAGKQAEAQTDATTGEQKDFGPSTDDHIEGDDFEGFSSEEDLQAEDNETSPPKKQKENPYVAPGPISGISAPPAAKYVPPSLRKPATSDEEMMRRLRQQVQGKVNKVSESNLISILREIEDIYKENARQHVTSTLIEILIGLITADVAHPDTVLITHAAFSAAVYKVVGTDFAAQLLEVMVERFDHFRGRKLGEGKQCLNLLAFLSYLYNFQVVGPELPFNYIRILLDELTEENTEMLLRTMRISGQQLRQDDPSALKDIVMLLQKLVNKTGEDNLSVRTKFMIETINNLKNNRVKTGLVGSAIAAEQTARMKKTLSTLNARAKATEPVRITLTDIQDTEKKGKWWLVGASYHDPAKLASTNTPTKSKPAEPEDAGYESETPGSVNLTKLAKQRGMNTDVRRGIFISLLSASDYKDAHVRLMKLHLRNKQMLEVPRVMLSCVGGEEAYNPFYALVARRLCSGARDVRKAFQFTLWGFWREIEGEGGEESEDEEDSGKEGVSVRKVVNVAKFYAALVTDGSLSLAVLKKLDFASMPAKESMFAEIFLTSLFFQLRRETKKEDDADAAFEDKVRKIFAVAGIGEVVEGLKMFLREVVEGSDLARSKKEKKTLRVGGRVAVEALGKMDSMAMAIGDDSGEESEG